MFELYHETTIYNTVYIICKSPSYPALKETPGSRLITNSNPAHQQINVRKTFLSSRYQWNTVSDKNFILNAPVTMIAMLFLSFANVDLKCGGYCAYVVWVAACTPIAVGARVATVRRRSLLLSTLYPACWTHHPNVICSTTAATLTDTPETDQTTLVGVKQVAFTFTCAEYAFDSIW